MNRNNINLRRKPERYRVRDEIESIIKEDNIDRSKFHEVSKFSYENILRKFYYTFFDYDKNVRYSEQKKIDLSYAWLRLRKNLETSEPVRMYYDDTDIESVKSLVPDCSGKKYVITEDGWVYEGEITEILKVLLPDISMFKDFYIISKKFDWAVVNCEDGECLFLVRK